MSDYIPEETVVEILKSLPVKSLLRFRCVCKQWNQIIESPSFIQQHLFVQNQNPNPSFLYHNKLCGSFLSVDPRTGPPLVDTLSSPSEITSAEYTIIGTLHGVVCLYNDSNHFLLWNPSIRKVSLLPLPERFLGWSGDLAGGCYISSAFWIDPCTKDFKIVFDLICVEMEDPGDGAIYSSAEHRWSHISEETKGVNCRHYGQRLPAVMLEGVAYWVAISGPNDFLKSFDFAQERYKVNETPLPYEVGTVCIPRVCNWRGNLSLVYFRDYVPCRSCEIYFMQQDLWVKMFRFNLLPDINDVFWVWGVMEEERFRAVVVDCDADFALYDTKDGCLVLGSAVIFDYDICYDFVESLFFPRVQGV